jgi:predicted helicase
MSCRSPTKPGRFNPRYPLDLFRRVITVSLETMKIVNDLPKLDIEE